MSQFDIITTGLEKALQATELHQKVLANNIANISTPGFKRSTVNFQESLSRVMGSGDSEKISGYAPTVSIDNSTIAKLDGNNVDLNVEMTQLAKNQLMNQAYLNLLHRRHSMMRYVSSDGRMA